MSYHGHLEEKTSIQGNFLELLKFRSKELPILQDRNLNLMYNCAITQNEIIELLGDNIRSQIQTQMRGHAFSIILDETPDTSNHEQVTFCVRWHY